MRSDRPIEALTKVTLNLYSSDVAAFRSRYGFGWSEQIRSLVHLNVKDWARAKVTMDNSLDLMAFNDPWNGDSFEDNGDDE